MKKMIFLLILLLAFAFNQKLEAPVKTDTVKTTLIKAQNLFKEGKSEEASKIYISLMESHPDNKEAVQGWIIANMKRTPTGEEEMIKSLGTGKKISEEHRNYFLQSIY
jgi:hypothetical protein